MFENVGRDNQRQRRRQAGALVVSLLLNGSVFTGLVWAGSQAVEEAKPPEAIERMFEIALLAPLPPAPAADPKTSRTEKKVAQTPDVAVPVVPLPDVTPVDEPPVDDTSDDAVGDAGMKDGVTDGITD